MDNDNNSDFLDDRDPIPEEKLEALKASLEKLVGSEARLDDTDNMVESIMQEYLANGFTDTEPSLDPAINQLIATQESWMKEVCRSLAKQQEMLDRQHRVLQKIEEEISKRNKWEKARTERRDATGFAVILGIAIVSYITLFLTIIPAPSKPETDLQREARKAQHEELEREAREYLKEKEAEKANQNKSN